MTEVFYTATSRAEQSRAEPRMIAAPHHAAGDTGDVSMDSNADRAIKSHAAVLIIAVSGRTKARCAMGLPNLAAQYTIYMIYIKYSNRRRKAKFHVAGMTWLNHL